MATETSESEYAFLPHKTSVPIVVDIGNGKSHPLKESKNNSYWKRCSPKTVALGACLWSLMVALPLLLFYLLCVQPALPKGDASLTKQSWPMACLDCAFLNMHLHYDVTHDHLLQEMTHQFTDGREMCCANNSEQISAMVQAVVRLAEHSESTVPSFNASDFQFSPVSAHKRIYPEAISHDFGDIHMPQRAQACHLKQGNFGGLEHSRGVVILKDRIKIKYSGLYYVYSSVLFRPQSVLPCREFDYSTFTHSIHKLSNHVYRQLLRTTYTCCDTCINSQESRFTGGLFFLMKGDYIQVKVREYRLVHFVPESSFVGIAMLGVAREEEEREKTEMNEADAEEEEMAGEKNEEVKENEGERVDGGTDESEGGDAEEEVEVEERKGIEEKSQGEHEGGYLNISARIRGEPG